MPIALVLLPVVAGAILWRVNAAHQRRLSAMEQLVRGDEVDAVLKLLGALGNELQLRANASVADRGRGGEDLWSPVHMWHDEGGQIAWDKSIALVRQTRLATADEIGAFNLVSIEVVAPVDLYSEEDIGVRADAVDQAARSLRAVRKRSVDRLAPNGSLAYRMTRPWRWLRRRMRRGKRQIARWRESRR